MMGDQTYYDEYTVFLVFLHVERLFSLLRVKVCCRMNFKLDPNLNNRTV